MENEDKNKELSLKEKLNKFSNDFKNFPLHKRLLYKLIGYLIIAFIFALIFTFFTEPTAWKGEIYVIQNNLNKKNHMFSYFNDMMHYSIDTLSTVGFGDIIPISKRSRFLTHLLMLLSFSLIVY